MKYLLSLLLLLGLAFTFSSPAPAQDGCGCECGCSVLEESDDSELDESDEDDGKPAHKQSGLSGQNKKDGPRDDKGAPKINLTLGEQIRIAIDRGVEWLKNKQDNRGSWGPTVANRLYGKPKSEGRYEGNFSGPTSFALYTLAKCDVPKKDKHVKKGMKWLKNNYRHSQMWNSKTTWKKGAGHNQSTYEIASLILCLEATYERSHKLLGKHTKRRLLSDNEKKPPSRGKIPKDEWRWMHEGIIYLTRGIPPAPRRRSYKGCQNINGLWRYGARQPNNADSSATQFVLLGLRSASQAGYPVPVSVWSKALKGLRTFKADGGFAYRKGQKPSDGMTAANLASMLICKEQIELAGQTAPGWVDGAVKNGLEWLGTRFDVARNEGPHEGGRYHYYYLYTIERLADMLGKKEIGGKDWYVRGAKLLLANQDASGAFADPSCMNPKDTLGTCFALLFLKRATPPVSTGGGD
ncbi:MAG: hypothetical protein V3T86_00850 [Planctomycetota bacterium]